MTACVGECPLRQARSERRCIFVQAVCSLDSFRADAVFGTVTCGAAVSNKREGTLVGRPGLPLRGYY